MIEVLRTVALALGAGAAAVFVLRKAREGLPAWAVGAGVASLVFAVTAFMTLGVGSETFFFWRMPPLDAEAVYRVNVNGSGLTKLTKRPLHYYPHYDALAWSPDGRKIAFGMQAPGLNGIYVMNADGTNSTNLTEGSSWDNNPVWSPDGGNILFTRSSYAKFAIYRISIDGSDCTKLVDTAVPCEWGGKPAWSPDGTTIAFTSERDGNPEIYVMNADGGEQINLTNNPARDYNPAWSPSGNNIVFDSDRDGNGEIYVMNADGSGLLNLTSSSEWERNGTWSPNGDRIAFVGFRGFANQVCVMNADGSQQTTLTSYSSDDFIGDLTWSPDGCKITYWRFRCGLGHRCKQADIQVMNADGTGMTRLMTMIVREADSPNARIPPSGFTWSPDSSKIAFVSIDIQAGIIQKAETLVTFGIFLFFGIAGSVAVGMGLKSWWKHGRNRRTTLCIISGTISAAILALYVIECW